MILLLLACAPSAAPEPVPVPPPPSSSEAVRPTDPSHPLTPALQRIFDGKPPCLSALSRVQVWRKADGSVHRLYYQGSLVCSHPPSIYFDAEGNALEMVPMEPITDANRTHYEELHARHQTGATAAESLSFSP